MKAHDSDKARMRAMYGVNSKIDGPYEEKNAVRCTNGTFVGREKEGILSFKGIPYAQPPTGERRWKKPLEAEEREGVYEAFWFGASPIQTEVPSECGSYYPQSENCLNLNIWTGSLPSRGRPVMVFLHGGSFGWGALCDPMYDGHRLVKRFDDIVLVTVEYRLGIMGFIDFSSVEGGDSFRESGNLGILDQICALKWIRKNIRGFGGDPDNVTVFGESAGAGSVSLLPMIDEADGLFHRIIAESGSVALTFSREECRNLTELLLKKTGCSTMRELMELPEETLKKVNEDLNDFNNFPERDGVVLPEDLYGMYKDGRCRNIDMMIGTNADEVRFWISEIGYHVPLIDGMTAYRFLMSVMFENNVKRLSPAEKKNVRTFLKKTGGKRIWRLTEFYNEMLFRLPAMKQALLHSRNGNRVYTYYWTYPGEDPVLGACHAMELTYVFGTLEEKILTGDHIDRKLADTVQEMWVNFARCGNPSTDRYTWDPYGLPERKTMVLSEKPHMEEDLKAEQRKLLEGLLHHYLNGCYSQLSYNVPCVMRPAAGLAGIAVILAYLIFGGKGINKLQKIPYSKEAV